MNINENTYRGRPFINPIAATKIFEEAPYDEMFYLNLGNYTQYKMGIFKTSYNQYLVAIEMVGAFEFPINHILHPDYVAEKLYLRESDALNITDFLNSQFQADKSYPRFGRYTESLCAITTT